MDSYGQWCPVAHASEILAERWTPLIVRELLAGSSHFLGVLPILAFPTQFQALSYLVMFALGTIVSMSVFSWVMGSLGTRCAARSTTVYKGLMSCCAALAMGVGCFWLLHQ